MKAITTQHIKRPLQLPVEQLPRTAARAARRGGGAGLCTLGPIDRTRDSQRGGMKLKNYLQEEMSDHTHTHTRLINPICCRPLSCLAREIFLFRRFGKAEDFSFSNEVFFFLGWGGSSKMSAIRVRQSRAGGGGAGGEGRCYVCGYSSGLNWFHPPPTRK